MLSLLHRFFHLRRCQNPTSDPSCFRLIVQDESARRCFIRHHDLAILNLLRSPPYLLKQPFTSSTVVHKSPPFRLALIHCDPCYRVLVSQIDSNENVIHHVRPVSFQKVWLCFIQSQSRDWPLFLHSELLYQGVEFACLNRSATSSYQEDLIKPRYSLKQFEPCPLAVLHSGAVHPLSVMWCRSQFSEAHE